ncbi:MAG: MFS transporter [Gammaproteobacteria bacterium]|nr:MFS transporter [Gammaproteobacteria bacterium]
MPSLPLTFPIKLAYGSGQFAEGLKNGAMGTFLVFYYSQVLGMPGSLAGLAVGTALIIDALTDPLAGSISDHWHSRWGRRHPFMMASMFPLGICFFLLFAPPVRGDMALFVWLVAFTNLTRTAMTFYHVPHLALGAELTTDYSGRVSLVGFRMFFNVFGGFAATMIGFQFFFAPSAAFPVGQLDPSTYAPFAATLAVLMVLSIFLSAWGTRAAIPFLPKAVIEAPVSVLGVLRRTLIDMIAALRLPSFRWLFSGVLLVYLMIGTNTALDLYMYTYFWEFSSADVVKLMPSYAVGIMIGAIFGPMFQQRFGKRGALLFGTVWWAVLQVLPIMLRLLGWFPDNDSDLLLPLLMGIRVVQGMGAIQANVAFGSALADVADENELRSGRRQEGIFFSTSSFSSKFASGIGSFIAGIALDLIAFPRGPLVRTAADVAPDTIVHLGLVYGPLVLSFSFLTMWCYSHYGLTRERHAEILRQLAERRSA